MHRACNTLSTQLPRCLLLAGLGLAFMPATAQQACELTCARSEACEVQIPGRKEAIDPKQYARFPNCAPITVTRGAVQLRYRHKGKPVTPILVASERVQDVFVRFPPDACAVSSRDCIQDRMNKKNIASAGQGIDSAKLNPAGTQDPCLRGLPCGVILPPPADWKFRLADRAFQGRMELAVLRGSAHAGSSRQLSFPVVQGQVQADGGQVKPAAVYGYRLLQADGTVVSTGEFTVLSASGLSTLKRLAGERAEKNGLSMEAAWVDALSANDLDWDTNQLIQER